MSKRARRNPVRTFFVNLSAGDYNALDRAQRVGSNLLRRDWFGRKRHGCCGNYGDPGC